MHRRYGPHCGPCVGRRVRTGHPEGHLLTRKEARKWLPLIRSLLRQHSEKKAIRAASLWAERLLNLPGDTAVHAELRRLKDKGVTPAELLEIIGAVFAYSHYEPRELPDDKRLTHCLANTVLRLRPAEVRYRPSGRGYKYERNTSTARMVLGGAIRSAIGLIFAQLLALHDREVEQERLLRADLKTPIDPNSPL
jgi:hypothetical protein